MAGANIWLPLGVFSCLMLAVQSNVRFVCPRPVSPRSDISFSNQSLQYCGLNTDRQITDALEVNSGLFTLRFEETVLSPNSPFRVSLHHLDNNEDCVLLDHIPHNNRAIVSPTCHDSANKYPLGSCESSTYYVTVLIPDITCDRCYIQVDIIQLDLKEETSIPCSLKNGTCRGFRSCANIKIRPSSAGSQNNISSCKHYEDNLPLDWPYRPEEQFKADLLVGQNRVEPLLIYDSLHQVLQIDIPRHGLPHEIEEVQVIHNTTVVWNITVTEDHKTFDTVYVKWQLEDTDILMTLKTGNLVLNLKCSKESYAGNISFKMQNYIPGEYKTAEFSEYSKGGWLADHSFHGLSAQSPDVVTPYGPCAPKSRNFISFLHPMKGFNFSHGLLVASFLESYVDITVGLFGLPSQVTQITIKGTYLFGAPDLKVPLSHLKNGILRVSLEASNYIQFIDTVRFLKQVVVETADPNFQLTGDFEEGIFTILRENHFVRGIGAFQFTKGQWLKYEILILEQPTKLQSVELMSGNTLHYNLSDSLWLLSPSAYLVEGLVQNLNSEFLLRLWQGLVWVSVNTIDPLVHLQGMLSKPGEIYCEAARDTSCFVFDLTRDGLPAPEGLDLDQPLGKAIFMLDRAGVLQYRVEVKNVAKSNRELEAKVQDGENLIFSFILSSDLDQVNTFMAEGHIPVAGRLSSQLSLGRLRLSIFCTNDPSASLLGFVPPIKTHQCTQPAEIVIGENSGLWSLDAAPLETIYALTGDRLLFIYTGNVTLFSMPNLNDFNHCNFDNASLLGPEAENGTVTKKVFSLVVPRTYYFTSQTYCNNSPALKVTVSAVQANGPTVGDLQSDTCGIKVFSDLHQQQLDTYTGPHLVGAIIAGLLIGALVAVAFVFWDQRLTQRTHSTMPGTRFQRF